MGDSQVKTSAHAELRFGFTMASLERLARKAAYGSHWRFLEFREKYEIAWSAIAEELYASTEPPRPDDLIRLGDKAIAAQVEVYGHMWGAYYSKPDREFMPRFETFWWSQAMPTPSPEDKVVDRLALGQIWPRLTQGNKRALLALATHGDYERAAASLGKTYSTFTTQIWQARRQFLRLWHEGERPSRVWGHDRRNRPRWPGVLDRRPVTITTIRKRRNRRRHAERQMQLNAGTSRGLAGNEESVMTEQEQFPHRVIRRHGPATR
ncbi:MAG TPA: hypothetical protein VH637_15255 [Streptosporangiaceae bacterium]|jgi:hypothetical protein